MKKENVERFARMLVIAREHLSKEDFAEYYLLANEFIKREMADANSRLSKTKDVNLYRYCMNPKKLEHEGYLVYRTGVYHDNGWAIVSNGKFLIASKSSYCQQYEGKTIGTNEDEIECNYPKWKSIIPQDGDSVCVFNITRDVAKKIMTDFKAAKKLDNEMNIITLVSGEHHVCCTWRTLKIMLETIITNGISDFNLSKRFGYLYTKHDDYISVFSSIPEMEEYNDTFIVNL